MALAGAKENSKIRLKVEWQQSYRGGEGGCKNDERKTKERKSWKKLLFKRFLNESYLVCWQPIYYRVFSVKKLRQSKCNALRLFVLKIVS